MKSLKFLSVLVILFGVAGLAAAQDIGPADKSVFNEINDGSSPVPIKAKIQDGNRQGDINPPGGSIKTTDRDIEAYKIKVEKEKKGIWETISDIANPAKPAPDWKQRDADWEAVRAKQAEENRQGMENAKNSPVYEILPDGTQRQVSGPIQEEKKSFLNIFKGNPEKIRPETENKLESLLAEAQARIESVKQEFEAKREEAKAALETKREALKEKLTAIKDEKKQETVSRLSENINELNKKKTGDYSAVIVKLERVWASIKAKSGEIADQAIAANIENSLVAVKESLNQQASRVYELNVSTENNLKTDIGQARQALESDLKAVREKIGAAKTLLYQAAAQFNKASSAPSTQAEQ